MSNHLDVLSKLEKNSREIYDETCRLLIKIAENVLKDPANLKLRTLQKSNVTISEKILGVSGGLECLTLMGFEENSVCFKLPLSTSLSKLKTVKNEISKRRSDPVAREVPSSSKRDGSQGAVPKCSVHAPYTDTVLPNTSRINKSFENSVEDTTLNSLDKAFEIILILLVKERPPLWNTSLPIIERTEVIKDTLWFEVQEAMLGLGNYEIATLQNYWTQIFEAYKQIEIGGYSIMIENCYKQCKFLSEIVNQEKPTGCLNEHVNSSEDIEVQKSVKDLIEEAVEKQKSRDTKINPICLKLSEILEDLPLQKRARLETDFLKLAYDVLIKEKEYDGF